MQTDSTIADDSPIDPDDELLVAYLDGELNPSERNELEERLLNDDALRKQLQSLQSGWEMLDSLIMPTVDEKLVESTLELVVADVEQLIPAKQSGSSAWKMPLAVLAMSVAAAVLGYGFVAAKQSRLERQRMIDLGIAENVHAYAQGVAHADGGDFSFFRNFAANHKWMTMVSTATQYGHITGDVSSAVSSIKLDQRGTSIADLPIENRAEIEPRWDFFQRKDEAEKAKLRQIAELIEKQPDGKFLLKIMSQYAAWIDSLPASMQDAVTSDDPDKQKAGIEAAIDETLGKLSRDSGTRAVDDESADRIYEQLQVLADDRIEVEPSLKRNPMERNIGMMLSDRAPQGNGTSLRITFEELQSLELSFSDKMKDDLDELALYSPMLGRNAVLEEVTLHAWAVEAFRRVVQRNYEQEEKSEIDRYREIPEQDRDMLDFQDPQDIKREISRTRRPGGPRGGGIGGGLRGGPSGRGPRDGGPRDGGPRDGGPRDGGPRDGGPR